MSEELVVDEFKDEIDEGKNSISSNELITTCSNKAYKDMYVVSILLLLNEQKYNLFSEPYSAIFTYHKYVLTLQATTSFEI